MTKNSHSGADAPGMFLETREERIKLLKSGFTGDQVESLYIDLNCFETLQVNWDDAATNRIRRTPNHILLPESTFRPILTEDSVRVQAASPQKARA